MMEHGHSKMLVYSQRQNGGLFIYAIGNMKHCVHSLPLLLKLLNVFLSIITMILPQIFITLKILPMNLINFTTLSLRLELVLSRHAMHLVYLEEDQEHLLITVKKIQTMMMILLQLFIRTTMITFSLSKSNSTLFIILFTMIHLNVPSKIMTLMVVLIINNSLHALILQFESLALGKIKLKLKKLSVSLVYCDKNFLVVLILLSFISSSFSSFV
mmetsp:Transcript_6965/g.9762  ORF Transcript_6965/g.9762 Transcript_6965/m.9762 type:complete len:214 (-) Transcript_6965:107-748(-)